MKENKHSFWSAVSEYGTITLSIWVMVIGIYFFKFPNHFAFGGITGLAPVFSQITGCPAGDFTMVVNILLLVVGFFFLGRGFGLKTVYATMMLSFGLSILEHICPIDRPLTNEPLLELMFAVTLPAVGTAILFNIGASSGGTDIIAMILKKHTSLNIGTVLMLVDIASVAASFLVFDMKTGLFSTIGLVTKSLVIDDVIENVNLCKCFNIICTNPDPICDFIINTLNRSATVYHAQGAFSHNEKTVIMTTMKRGEALKLRNYIRQVEPSAFMLISNSSEIIGKGFLAR